MKTSSRESHLPSGPARCLKCAAVAGSLRMNSRLPLPPFRLASAAMKPWPSMLLCPARMKTLTGLASAADEACAGRSASRVTMAILVRFIGCGYAPTADPLWQGLLTSGCGDDVALGGFRLRSFGEHQRRDGLAQLLDCLFE